MTALDPVTRATASREAGRTPVTVVYVAGSGRSGSTLLERLLGAIPGMVNVGELIDVFRRVAAGDELCGCGRPFSECPLWGQVGTLAFGGWSPDVVEEVRRAQLTVARQRHLGWLLVPSAAPAGHRGALHRYADIYARLYAAVRDVAGARVVVDASKGVAQAVAVSQAQGVDLRLIHLVRDARGVAFSWAKSDVARPQGRRHGATMARHRPQITAARWGGLQTEIALARRSFAESTVLRYEDLVRHPEREVSALLERLHLPVARDALAHIDGQDVDLPASHGLSGNPSRFRLGRQELRLDEQWRRDMGRWDRLSTSAIAAVPLAVHGYLSHRQGRS